MQLMVFFLLGLLCTPSKLGSVILPALAIAVVLTFVARPLVVGVLLTPFRAKLPWFRIAEETKAMLRRMVESGEVDALVPERVTAEIRKALKEANPSIFFDELEANGFIARVYPEWKQTDFSRGLLDRLASGFTEEEKFAASVASVDPDKLLNLLESLRMPKRLTEFAQLFSESLRDGFRECR